MSVIFFRIRIFALIPQTDAYLKIRIDTPIFQCFIRTVLERYVLHLGISIHSAAMRTALETLNIDHLWIIYPGLQSYPVHDKISILPVRDIPSIRDQLRQK